MASGNVWSFDNVGFYHGAATYYRLPHVVKNVTFAFVHGVRLLRLVPRKVMGFFGTREPVLDMVITVEPKERTRFALIEEVC